MRRVRCPYCTRQIPVSTPAGGDGSVDVFRRHAVIPGGRVICDGSRATVQARR